MGHIHPARTEECYQLHATIRRQQKSNYAGFEIHTTATMKGTMFWNVTPCSRVEFIGLSEKRSSENSVKFCRTTRSHIPYLQK
jgi:hypothetical protein